jgi:hypothetical protein
MIIGRDFFKAHDVIVNHANDSMLVDGLNINLNTIHSIATHIFEDRDDELTDRPPEVSIQEQLKIIHIKLSELTSQKSVVGPILASFDTTTTSNTSTTESDRIIDDGQVLQPES